MTNPLNYLVEKLKGPKELPWGHWRFRLLHWVWGINPANKEESTCPKYLYTHYCPLFHLTNIFLAIFPLIFAYKLIKLVLLPIKWALLALVDCIPEKPHKYYDGSYSFYSTLDKYPAPQLKMRKDYVRERIWSRLLNEPFSDWWLDRRFTYSDFTTEQAEELWNNGCAAKQKQEELAKAKRAKMEAWTLFLVNFSRVFFKVTMPLFYGALFLLSCYVTTLIAWPITYFTINTFILALSYMSGINYGGLLSAVLFWGAILVGTCFGGVFLYTLLKETEVGAKFKTAARTTLFPLTLVLDIFLACCRALKNFVVGAAEFVVIFYENSCPPIKIVEDE